MIPGIVSAGAASSAALPSVPISLVYQTQTKGASSSYSSQPLGAAAANRHIIVALSSVRLSSTAVGAHSSLTVAGAGCTKLAEASSGVTSPSASGQRTSLWITTSPLVSGTTGTIAFSVGTANYTSIIVWAAYGVGSITPYDYKTVIGTGALSASINCPQDGALIAAAALNATSLATISWSGITEDVDDSNNVMKFGGASLASLSAETARAISATQSATSVYPGGLVAVTLLPV
jgi:hypothetical protein